MDNLMINLNPVQGTRDFFPEEMMKRNWLFDMWRHIAESFAFKQYDASVVEHAALYTRKGGDDIVNEGYYFEKDDVKLALRPEMTPSLARMVMQRWPSETPPLKWFSIPQCWRYETTARGRKREHYQWNCDILGGDVVNGEVEVFNIIVTFLKQIKLTSDDIVIKVSNRKILQKLLNDMNVPDDKFARTCILIDKMNKMSREDLTQCLYDEIGLTKENVDKIYKITSVRNISELESFLGSDDSTFIEMKEIFDIVDKLGISSWIQLDLSVIRGLSYYTGIVFEGFFKNSQLQRAVFGGGRYDNLLKSYGFHEQVSAIGFGFGDVVILDVLQELKLLPSFEIENEYVIVPFNKDYLYAAHLVANKLREKGKIVDVVCKNGEIKNQFNYANKKNASYVIMIAPDEWKENKTCVKNMKLSQSESNKQITIDLNEYVDSL